MQENISFTITTLYDQAFMDAETHLVIERLKNSTDSLSTNNQENLDRLGTDKYFYTKLVAARTAAYDNEIDGRNGYKIISEFHYPIFKPSPWIG